MWYFEKMSLLAIFLAQKLQMIIRQQLNTHRISKRLAKALISLRSLVLAFAGRTIHHVTAQTCLKVAFAHTQKSTRIP